MADITLCVYWRSRDILTETFYGAQLHTPPWLPDLDALGVFLTSAVCALLLSGGWYCGWAHKQADPCWLWLVVTVCPLVGKEGPWSNWLQRGFPNGTCQCQCWYNKMRSPKCLLPASPSPGGAPDSLLPLQRLFKISKWVSLRIILKSCPFAGTWSLWDFARAKSQGRSLFPVALQLSQMEAQLVFKAWLLGPNLPHARFPGYGTWCGAWTPCSSGRTSALVISTSFVGHWP